MLILLYALYNTHTYAIYNIRCIICIERIIKYNTIIQAKYVKDALQFISSLISDELNKIL